MPQQNAPASYWDYIRVEELLALQNGVDASEQDLTNDEIRFIVIHQIDELWFKLVLRELEAARNLFAQDPVPETALTSAVAGLRRIGTVFDLASQHFRLMETMRTQDYLTFRDKLNPASGFQSAQMREIEILFGLEDQDRVPFGNEKSYRDALKDAHGRTSPALQRVERRAAGGPSLRTVLNQWLARAPIRGSSPSDENDESVVNHFIEEFLQGHEQLHDRAIAHAIGVQALTAEDEARLRARYEAQLDGARRHLQADDVNEEDRAFRRRLRAAILFVDSNRELPLLSWPGQIIDAVIECEQAMILFRQRHARMVERVIGRRVGTGGSDGVAYLDETARRYRVFHEIWAARTLLLPPGLSPSAGDRDYYGLVQQ
jgi:tryptophan 2,3-dioxygenase